MGMKYPLIKPELGDEELEAVKQVFESGYLTEGPVTKDFANDFAAYCGAKHGIAFTSCTTALETALRALGIGPGDEVIVPDFTYPATAQAVYLVGATPILVDIDRHTYNIDYEKLKIAITPKTKAIMPVSLFGNPLDYAILNEIKQQHNVFIIEDAACSAGASVGSTKVGCSADISCFSLHPRKVITTGEGGVATTNSEEIAAELTSFKYFGMTKDAQRNKMEFTKRVATNYKLSNILGAIGSVQLKKLDAVVASRVKLAQHYDELLQDNEYMTAPFVTPNTTHNYQSYCVLLKKPGIRDQVIQLTREHGIETQIGTFALSLQPAFAETESRGELENSKFVYENGLTLPLAHDLTQDDQKLIINTITEILKKL